MKFQGSENYVATPDLMLAVNAAIQLQRPLLVKGEPGTGKTMLAEEAAQALGLPLLQWHIKSTTKAQQGLSKRLDGGLHDAHHAAMECLGQMLADSQRSGLPPDGATYVAAVQRRATRD